MNEQSVPRGVVVSLTAEGEKALSATAAAREAGAVLAEWRVDAWQRPETAPDFLSQAMLPVLITCRPASQGGYFEGSDGEHQAILEKALALGAAFVDWDFPLNEPPPYIDPARLVLSWHLAGPLEDEPKARLVSFLSHKAAVHKLVVSARALKDLVAVRSFLKEAKTPAAVFAMGEAGTPSRILALSWGSCWTYAPPAGEPATAPGQVDLQSLQSVYRVRDIPADAVPFGVIGRPVMHSRSPHMHNPRFREEGLSAVYLPFPGGDFRQDLQALRELGVRGLSVTTPFKEEAYRAAQHNDGACTALQATNTLLFREGKWWGENTDVEGIRQAVLEALYPGEEKKRPFARALMAVIGAGGAARAAAYAFRDARQVMILNRSEEKARDMAVQFNRLVGSGYRTPTYTAAGLSGLKGLNPDVLVQCTPVGMEGGPAGEFAGSPVNPEHLSPETRLVVDMIYAPEETALLKAAREKGIATQNGLGMLKHQGDVQFQRFKALLSGGDD